ncbi:uncharacterized protein TRUGW13939_05479 [Talaromyces rugulosus]|uniref:Uncharacterized protein n=1 Tax=Talaromyces rugulosus TaxID=121627 RepID=A0A7H8QWP3_TALRU|nr:uncharacterized protein TRUGW13939_05479 [Talaromyces rugulosus]QKX58357.1 hypothetical protein TRUGW13939_05479 [Talaromyces rugulosus]
MAFHPMDALQCFTTIGENVPSWITRVTELAAHTAKKHAEFSAEYKKLADTLPPRRRKNSSVHSIRSEVAAAAVTQSKRGEDATSIASDQISRFSRQRPRVVIQYDNHTQKELEQTVRDIGAARNNIRKGKMSQVMRRPNLTMEMFSSRSRDSLRNPALPMDSLVRVQAPRETPAQQESAFDFTDKQLETAQSLCESAAHQFIRTGDCSTQLDTILEKFNLVLTATRKEVDRLHAEKPADIDDEKVESETLAAPAIFMTVDCGEDGKAPDPEIAAIEVDDAPSESSVSIDITAFRSNRFRV